MRLLAALVTISYFFAVLFKIMLDIQQDIAQVDWGALQDGDSRSEWFLSNFLMDYDTNDEDACTEKPCQYKKQDSMLVFLKLLYFAFTSLTTVGFGDFHPRSDTERIFTAFGLLLGVAVFSIVIGNILLMIDSYKEFHEIYEDSEAL